MSHLQQLRLSRYPGGQDLPSDTLQGQWTGDSGSDRPFQALRLSLRDTVSRILPPRTVRPAAAALRTKKDEVEIGQVQRGYKVPQAMRGMQNRGRTPTHSQTHGKLKMVECGLKKQPCRLCWRTQIPASTDEGRCRGSDSGHSGREQAGQHGERPTESLCAERNRMQ